MSGHAHGFHDLDLEGVDPLSIEVFRSFKTAMIMQRRLVMRLLAEDGLHPAQAGCLWMLGTEDGMSQSDLAGRLNVAKPTVTTMLQKMEAAGLIERRRDEHDQRLTRIYVTPAGKQASGKMREVHRDMLQNTVGRMSEKDRGDLVRLLQRLNERLRAALAEAEPSADTTEKGTHE